MSLSRKEARIIIEAGIAEAERLGQRVAVAVLDDSGRLVALDQMDGTKHKRDEFARGKAFCSLLLRQPTSEAKEMLNTSPARFHSLLSMFPGQIYLTFGGGMPIFNGEEFVGAVGIAGGKEGDDDAMCEAGIKAWRESLDQA